MTSTQVLIGGLTAALLWCGETTATAPAPGPQDSQPSLLELARAALDQPGADHRLERENAVKTLLSMTEQPAHISLQDRLAAGDDADQVSLYILEELDRRISNPNDTLFGIPNGEAGSMLLKSYVPALVSAFIEEGSDVDVEKHRRLRSKSLDCLVHMQARARLEGLQAMLAPGIQDLEMQRAALRAAANCRETGLANLLGDQLVGDLGEIARQGLQQLTFVNFGTGPGGKKKFDEWWNSNRDKTYVDIVENVARTAGRVRIEQDDKLIETQVLLMEALIGQQAVKWQEIHELVLADNPTGAMSACLTKLAAILQFKDHDGNAAEARIEFHSALLQRLPGAEIKEKVMLLEIAAYLIRPQEDRERQLMEAVLVQELGSEYLSLRLAALRGLQRFPSPANRAAVVQVAKDSLASSGEDELITLRMALRTLHGLGWHAPSQAEADYPDWIQVLRQVFDRTEASELLQEGIEVALVADEAGGHLTEVFGLLMELAVEPEVEINHRIQVLLNIREFITAENANSYLSSVLSLLDDDRFEIRVRAALLLAQPPESRDIADMEEWLLQIRQKVAGRLPHERQSGVFQALVDCLFVLSDDSPENVIAIFKNAMDILPETQMSHREIVITALTKLGLRTDLEVAQWQIAADVLLENDRRDSALAILNKHNAGELTGQAPADVQRGLELLVRAAILKPAGLSRHSEEEAQDVLAAFAKLDTDFGIVQNDAAHQLLRLQLHDVLENNGAIISLGALFLEDEAALTPTKDQVLILMAGAALRQGEALEARQTMGRLTEQGLKTSPALAVSHQVGQSLMTQESTAGMAVEVLTKVVEYTHPDADEYRERFLDLAQATLTLPGKRTEVVEMLEAKRSLFEADDCPADEKARFDKLLEAASA